MAEKTELEVLLDGKVYKISGYESVEYMQKVANYINAKERDLKANSSFNKLPDVLRAYLMHLNIADDYFKMKQQNEELKVELEKKERDIYKIKHEAAGLQTQIARMKRGEDPEEEPESEVRTTGGAYDDKERHFEKRNKHKNRHHYENGQGGASCAGGEPGDMQSGN